MCMGGNPCKNGGTCAPDGSSTGFKCTCMGGYAGIECTVRNQHTYICQTSFKLLKIYIPNEHFFNCFSTMKYPLGTSENT